MIVLQLVRGGGAIRTKSAVKKRFRVNGGGLLIRKQSGKRERDPRAGARAIGALAHHRSCADAPPSRPIPSLPLRARSQGT